MQILEIAIEKPVCKWADAVGLMHLKLNVFGRRGYPDRLFFIPGGRPALIEFKRPGKEPRKLQRFIINSLRGFNYDVLSTSSAKEAIDWLVERCRVGGFHVTGLETTSIPKNGCAISTEANISRAVPRSRIR